MIGFDKRPFTDIDEMDQCLINNWNACVQPEDTVYILGDFCYKGGMATKWYLQQLKGSDYRQSRWENFTRSGGNEVF